MCLPEGSGGGPEGSCEQLLMMTANVRLSQLTGRLPPLPRSGLFPCSHLLQVGPPQARHPAGFLLLIHSEGKQGLGGKDLGLGSIRCQLSPPSPSFISSKMGIVGGPREGAERKPTEMGLQRLCEALHTSQVASVLSPSQAPLPTAEAMNLLGPEALSPPSLYRLSIPWLQPLCRGRDSIK